MPKAPVFDAPKLTVPREIRAPRPQQPEVAPPKIEVNHFTPAVVKQVTGGARPTLIVHTGEFGSSATPTVNAPIQKVQTGGFGDPNGIPGQGKPNAHLVAASPVRLICRPDREPATERAATKGIKGTVASAGFGNGIAQAGQGDGRSNGRGSHGADRRFRRPSKFSQGAVRRTAGESWTCYDTCGNHLQAQSGLH